MASADETHIRACPVHEGSGEDANPGQVAAVIAEEIQLGADGRVDHDYFDAWLAQTDARIAQLGREFAERDARLAREMRDFIASMQEIEHQRDERERQRYEREHQRYGREHQRDEREREREAHWDQQDRRFQRVVYGALAVGLADLGILIAVLILVI
jgi:hypothetical protein